MCISGKYRRRLQCHENSTLQNDQKNINTDFASTAKYKLNLSHICSILVPKPGSAMGPNAERTSITSEALQPADILVSEGYHKMAARGHLAVAPLHQSGPSKVALPTWLGGLAEASGGGGAGGPEGVLVGRVFAGLPAQATEEPAPGPSAAAAAAGGPSGAGPEQTTAARLLLLLPGETQTLG